jgi:putative transcriptional regulator
MREPTHHTPDALLAAYAAGTLPYPFAVLVAAHVSLCDACRAGLEAHHLLGGLTLAGQPSADLSAGARERTLAALDQPRPAEPTPQRRGVYPAPLAGLLGDTEPRWRSLGFGTKQAILWRGHEGSLRLLSIPGGQAVPDHGHRGLELTLVLAGSFSDAAGSYGPGDLEVADEAVEHVPVAGAGEPCICAAATDAPLRFRSMVPRLLQPVFGI